MSEKDHQYTVLLAEDDGFQRLTVENVLQMCGYAVIAVENGKLAMDELINWKEVKSKASHATSGTLATTHTERATAATPAALDADVPGDASSA